MTNLDANEKRELRNRFIGPGTKTPMGTTTAQDAYQLVQDIKYSGQEAIRRNYYGDKEGKNELGKEEGTKALGNTKESDIA